MTTKRIFFTIICFLCPIVTTFSVLIYGRSISGILQFLFIFIGVLIATLFFLFYKIKKHAIAKLCLILNVISTIVIVSYLFLNGKNLLSIFYSVNSFKSFILSTGNGGILVYMLIQAVQVVFLPVPAAVIALAGSLIYGPFLGGLYCSIGVLLGSNLSYALGRLFGYRLVSWVAGENNAIKYTNILNNKGKLFLPMSFLLPMFPDDILCLISGMTKMKYSFFLAATTLTRPIGVFCMCLFGGGYIIPFAGWGLYVWCVIAVIMTFVIYYTYKYQEKIENWLITILKPKKNKAS